MSGFINTGGGGGGGLTPPANPGDDGFVAIANAGDLIYVGGTAAGEALIWNGTDWVSGAVDLADANAITGDLPLANLGGVGPPDAVLISNGANWLAGQVSLTAGVTGLLPLANLGGGFGAAGNVLVSNGASWAAGAVNLADTDAVTGALPLANLGGFGAAGSVLRSTGAAWASGQLDLADTDAVTGRLPVDNLALGPARSVLTSNAVANSWSATPNVDGLYIGATLPTTGAERWAHGTNVVARNSGNTADREVIDFGATTADQLTVGGSNAVTAVRSSSGGVFIQTVGSSRVSFTGTAMNMQAGVNMSFVGTHTGPTISQANNTTAGATASDMTIQAQNATGGGASIGGDLFLTSGSGTTNGHTYLQTAGVNRLDVSDTILESLVATFQFDGNVGACSISQEAPPGAGAGSTMSITAQNAGGAGNDEGGRLDLSGGTGTGTGRGRGVTMSVERGGAGAGTNLELTQLTNATTILSLFLDARLTSTQMPANSGDRVAFVGDRGSEPAANPVGGHIYWSVGGVPAWRTAAGDIAIWSLTAAATATGGAASIPVLAVEYLTFTYNGNVRKIALFAA